MSDKQTRDIGDGPFCWQSKAARRAIRDAADSFPRLVTASAVLGVYDALAEIASDEQAGHFSVAQDWIALKAAVTRKTVQRVLPILRDLGLLWSSEPRGLRVKTKYTLLAMGPRDASMGPTVPTLGHGDIHSTCPTSEESPKNLLKESPKKGPPLAQPDGTGFATPATSPVLTFPVAGKERSWDLPADLLAKLTETHPGLDVLAQCRKALAKIETGAVSHKTARGMPRFLWNWMDRDQNGYRPNVANATASDAVAGSLSRA